MSWTWDTSCGHARLVEAETGVPILTAIPGLASLCGKWLYSGADEQEDAKQLTPRPHDCKACVKQYNLIRAEVSGATFPAAQAEGGAS